MIWSSPDCVWPRTPVLLPTTLSRVVFVHLLQPELTETSLVESGQSSDTAIASQMEKPTKQALEVLTEGGEAAFPMSKY